MEEPQISEVEKLVSEEIELTPEVLSLKSCA